MNRTLLLLFLCALALALGGCQTPATLGGRVILSDTYHIPAGRVLDGDLLILGGEAWVAPGASITGSLILLDGQAIIGGNVAGNVLALGGQLTMQESATIAGGLNIGGGQVKGLQSSQVGGAIQRSELTNASQPPTPAGKTLNLLLEALFLLLVTGLTTRCLPGNLTRLGQALQKSWPACLAMGLLVWMAGLSLVVLMAYTILLIPVSALLLLGMFIAATVGAIPFLQGLGQIVSARLRWKTTPLGASLLGTVLILGITEITQQISWVGIVPLFLLLSTALGASYLTRLGFFRFTPET